MADIAESAGDRHLGTVVINVQDMSRAVGSWAAALGSEFCVVGHPGQLVQR
jgi:hypothetical protein